jgi:glycosyltransferase involved in cell wall biosynthesis
MFLSVIICTFNRERLLENCLAALSLQTFNECQFEIIVIDNNSRDNTAAVAKLFSKKCKNWRYYFEPRQGLSFARNRGYGEARGDYLIYHDDDTIAPKFYMKNVFSAIMKFEPDIMGGPIYPYYTCTKPAWFKDAYEIRKYEEVSCYSKNCRVSGGNFIIKKSVLEKIGMFDVRLGMIGDKTRLGEDAQVLDSYRMTIPNLKQRVYYSLECHIYHHVPKYKLKKSYQLKRWYCMGQLSSFRRPRSLGPLAKVVFRRLLRELLNLFKDVRQSGLIHANYIFFLRELAYLTGLIGEWLNGLPELQKRLIDYRLSCKKKAVIDESYLRNSSN